VMDTKTDFNLFQVNWDVGDTIIEITEKHE
jgi:hypothetical protein